MQSMTPQERKIVLRTSIVLFVVALVIRLVALACNSALLTVDLHHDAQQYDYLARNLLESGNYIDIKGQLAIVTPLYPLLLAGIYWLSGMDRLAVLLFQCGAGAATVVLVYWIGLRLFSHRAAAAAGIGTAIYWPMIILSLHLLSEALFIPLLAATLLITIKALQEDKPADYALAGVLIGLASLTRSFTFYWAPLLTIWFVWSGFRYGRSPNNKRIFLYLAMFFLTMAPWAIRNQIALGSPIFTSSNSGMVLASSLMPREGKIFGFNLRPSDLDPEDRYIFELGELETNQALSRIAINHALQNLDQLPRQLLLKVLYFFSFFDWEILGNPNGVFNPWYFWVILLAVGGFACSSLNRSRNLALALVAYFFLLCMAAYGSPRLRLPVEIVLILYAGAGWEAIERITTLRVRLLLTAGIIAVSAAGYQYSAQLKSFFSGLMSSIGLW